MHAPLVSIVICTHRRPELLRLALESLLNQENVPQDAFEVIVVDNDLVPNPAVQGVVGDSSSNLPVRYVHEPQIGLSFARNTGGQTARSEYIGYIDDDAKARPTYIHQLIKDLQTFKPDLCGGPFFPFYQCEKPDWYRDQYGSSAYGSSARTFASREYLSGGNITFHHSIFNELGWFDSSLGMKGSKTCYGEETALQIKAWKNKPDLRVYFDPEVAVDHLVPRRKMTVRWFFKMKYYLGSSMPYFWVPEEQISHVRRQAGWKLIRICLKLVFLGSFGVIFRDRQVYPFWQNYAVERLAQTFAAIGQEAQYLKDWLLQRPLHTGLCE
jgi:glucosyl-dolichyl phosphate glucuronosyltransferase